VDPRAGLYDVKRKFLILRRLEHRTLSRLVTWPVAITIALSRLYFDTHVPSSDTKIFKCLSSEVDHSPPSSEDFKNDGAITATPPHIFMA
jgi:hypothetical protein